MATTAAKTKVQTATIQAMEQELTATEIGKQVLWLGSLLPRLLTTPNGSQRLPTASYDYKHTLLLFSSSMTPTNFQRLPPRELTPQPYSKGHR